MQFIRSRTSENP